MSTTCYSCERSLTCFMRIQTARSIHNFKLLAANSTEARKTGRSNTTLDIWTTIAGACTAYTPQRENTNDAEGPVSGSE